MRTALLLTPLLLAAACAGGGGSTPTSEPTSASTPSDRIDLSGHVTAMDALTSYRMDITFSPEGDPFATIVDYADPGDYYYLLLFEGESLEAIVVGDSAYNRNCSDYPDDCEPWSLPEERPPISSLGGLTTVIPETLPFVILELAVDPAFAGREDIDGQPVDHLTASVKLGRSILENKSRELRKVDIEDPEIEDALGNPLVAFEPDARVDLWVSPNDAVIHRILISVPGDPDDPYLDITFSRFNEVVVDAPR